MDIEKIIAEQEQAFSGVVMVRRGGEIIHAKGYGLAHRAEEIPNRIDTRFGTASGTKTFTATAVCQLAEAGKIDLDTPISEYLREGLPKYDPGVTVHQLLSHTSGIADYLDDDLSDEDYAALFARYPVYTLCGPADYLTMFPNGMAFKPGERFVYNNGAYILLALLVETQSGMPYAKYVEENVFARAGMNDSGFFESDQLPARTALGYLAGQGDGIWRTNVFLLPIRGGGDGGAYVTAPDMSKFWDALHSDQLMSKAMREQMLSIQATDADDLTGNYGYGVWIVTDAAGQITRYGAIGEDQGVAFSSVVLPQHDSLITVISNTKEGPTWALSRDLRTAITG
ncbi:MAG: serine hydrolase domain-containing protein [bacterium]|nr:serine hydrolase domain-containing protein [bacterium]